MLCCLGCIGLTRLPERLPASLEILYCKGCTGLTHFPESLPESLRDLNCDNCTGLTSITDPLPGGLKYIDCCNCNLLISEEPRVLEQIDIEANRKRHLQIQEMKEILHQRESEKWTLMCMGLGDSHSPVKYLCTDVLQIIHSYSKEHVQQEYNQNRINILEEL